MMRLVAVQTMQVPAQQEAIAIVGRAAMVTITRGWFQCEDCALIGAFEPMASPMAPPPCSQGCDDGPLL